MCVCVYKIAIFSLFGPTKKEYIYHIYQPLRSGRI